MVSLRVKEVQTVAALLDGDGVQVCVVAQNQLLQIQEGLLVGHLLSDLHTSSPGVGSEGFGTVGTLCGDHNVLDLEALLDDGLAHSLALDGDLDSDTSGVGLGPDEGGVHKTHLGQTLESLETKSQQLSGLGLGSGP